jgi:hypothetical protein
MNASRRPRVEGARCNKSTPAEQGPRPVRRSWWRAVRGHISADCGVSSRTSPATRLAAGGLRETGFRRIPWSLGRTQRRLQVIGI